MSVLEAYPRAASGHILHVIVILRQDRIEAKLSGARLARRRREMRIVRSLASGRLHWRSRKKRLRVSPPVSELGVS